MVSAFKHKKLIVILLLLVGALLVFSGYKIWKALSHHSNRRPIPEIQLATVDLPRIRNEALAFVAFRELIERQYKSFHIEIMELEQHLRQRYGLIKEKESKSSTLAKDLNNEKDLLDKEVSELEKTIRQRKEKLAQNFEDISQKIETKLQQIIAKIAQERHLNLVFNTSSIGDSAVLFGSQELDISSEVISKLNKELPTVHLPS